MEEVKNEETINVVPTYKVVTLRKSVLFPSQSIVVDFVKDKSSAAINAMGATGNVVVVSQKKSEIL